MTIDVWMQHPTRRFLADDMVSSLRRWTGGSMIMHDRALDGLDDLGLDDTARADYLSGNAERVFTLDMG